MRRIMVLCAALCGLAVVPAAQAHETYTDIPWQQDTWCGTNEPDEPGCIFWYGHEHRDVVDGSNTDDYLYGKEGQDELVGHGNPDGLYGGPDNDDLFGGSSHDHMFGGKGNDVLDCGDNDGDQATGGDGADTFIDCENVMDVQPWDTLIRSCDWNDPCGAVRKAGTTRH